MGRGAATERVPVEVVLETFRVRQDGALIRIKCRIGARVDEPATHRGPGGRLLVRVYVDDKVERFAAGRDRVGRALRRMAAGRGEMPQRR